ncbi:hypothetical protein [Phocaeicola sp.]|uniref:hypothetical protein n=1 Tax=Phocaeicola sp. TaxID=2773926 RepID=UPI0023D45036|nr:S26 family signal peptidase [Phocaeicola sp.]
MKKHWRKIAQYAIDTAFWLCMLGVAWIVAQVFLFTSFKIPSDSMEPELTARDNILSGSLLSVRACSTCPLPCGWSRRRFTGFRESKASNAMMCWY